MSTVTESLQKDIILVDRLEGNKIPAGSYLYCGHCGEVIATLVCNLTFPFTLEAMTESVADANFRITPFGIKHKVCEHIIRANKGIIKFKSR